MIDLTKEDQAAMEIAVVKTSGQMKHDISSTLYYKAGFKAACAYKGKRITELEKYINELKDELGWARKIDISEGGGE